MSRWQNDVRSIQGSELNVKMLPSIAVYLLISLGVTIFLFDKINPDHWILGSLGYGFLWGFITYGVFDLTNLGLFDKYDQTTALMDMLWGGTVTAVSTLITYAILRNFGNNKIM